MSRPLGFLGAAGAATLLFGCATIDPAPFERFRVTTERIRTGVDALLLLDYEWSKRGFVDRLERESPESLGILFLEFDPVDPFRARLEEPPLFFGIRTDRDRLSRVAVAFVRYANLLARLTGNRPPDGAAFDELARDLNSALQRAEATLGTHDPEQARGRRALLSTGASEAIRSYFDRNRARELRRTITEADPLVVRLAEAAAEATQNVRDDLRTEYDARKVVLSRHYAEARKGRSRREPRARIEELIELDLTLLDTLSTLEALRETFRTLPEAHAELGEQIDEPDAPRDRLREFYERGRHLRDLYLELTRARSRRR